MASTGLIVGAVCGLLWLVGIGSVLAWRAWNHPGATPGQRQAAMIVGGLGALGVVFLAMSIVAVINANSV